MCSIFGIITNGERLSEGLQEKFLQSLHHRGPDDNGVFCDGTAMIGMNRLSIIDLETGHQPISDEDGSLQICFNGEIYNYQELRKTLISKGHRFKTTSDTEVILHAYEEYGPDCLQQLNGMFAFVIWNTVSREGFIARDRLGIKPLYYSFENGRLCFASELKSMLAVLDDPGEVNRLGLSRYFSFGYVPSPQTPFTKIKKLPAGYYMSFRKGNLDLRSFWNVSLGASEAGSPFDLQEEIGEIASTLETAIGMELMSDVPLGCFLSGGVDSSAIVALAQKYQNNPLHTFCFKFAEKTHDESEDALVVARHLNSTHHEIQFSKKEIIDALEALTDSLDEPFADSTFLTLSLLSGEVRKHVKVILTGMGGDEVFTGYPTIKAHRFMQAFKRLPSFIRQGIVPPLVNALPVSNKYFSFEFKAKRFVRGQDFPQEVQHFIWMENFSLQEKKQLLGDFVPERSVIETYENVLQELARCDARDPMNRILYLDMKFFLENNGLFQIDRSTMAHSLEARVPLLNTRVLDKLFTIPFDLKFYKAQTKYLLTQAVRNHLPRSVFTKPKKGFGPPASIWLRTFLKDFLLQTLSQEQLSNSPLNYDIVQSMIREHLRSTADHGRALWSLLIFQMWWKKYAR
ncbi:MAG: asparagine synthase (glutamine-hydrolyzing) [Nitrospinota bacterium]|nr:asparagine synthase (glutamine-hydrolyzing) [Nitrospinota bacterium]